MFNGEKLKVGDTLDPSLYGQYSSKFEIDESVLLIGTMMHINIAIEYLKK